MKRKKLVKKGKDGKAGMVLPTIPKVLTTDDYFAIGETIRKSLEITNTYYKTYNKAMEQFHIKTLLGQEVSSEELDNLDTLSNMRPEMDKLSADANKLYDDLNSRFSCFKTEED